MTNKTIWLTGASSGIGEALAYHLSAKGARLILSSRRVDELERVISQCEGSPENIKILPLDLAQADCLATATQQAIQLFGYIDILINNGGISQRSLTKDTDLSVYRKLMEVNYFGTIAITKYLLPHFVERKNGHFVVITSLVGKFGTPYRSGYSAAKHALHGFFDSLRAEVFNDNIKVSIICPGFIHTNVSVNALTEKGDKLNQMDEAQANGMSPEECARQITKAIEKEKLEVYIGGKERFGVYLKRFLPGYFAKMVRGARVR